MREFAVPGGRVIRGSLRLLPEGAPLRIMTRKTANLQSFLYLISAGILPAGLGCAILVYRSAMNASNDVPGYEVIGGFVYPNNFEHSKKYEHDLQLYGGKAAVLADDFMRWFSSLWRGESLAYTIAGITIVLSFCGFLAARNVQLHRTGNVHGETPGGGTG
jgi:hypothetical protein